MGPLGPPTTSLATLQGISTQPEISRTPGRKSVPNPLFKLITNYNYEESSEVSLVTPVQITEEKEPEGASTPGPDAPIQSLPQRENEVKSSLETKIMNFSGTPMDILRDELGSGGRKEEFS